VKKEKLIRIGLSVVAAAATLQPTVIHSVLTFFLFGEVPGTTLVVPAWFMLTGYVLALGILAHWAATRGLYFLLQKMTETQRKKKWVRSLTKRRRFRHSEIS